MTQCPECHSRATVSSGAYRYRESGLPNVVLLGARVLRCPKCGHEETSIPRIAELHRVIADALARHQAALAPAEVRFLRKFLGLSGADFAAHLGVTPETVSRWETGKANMGAVAERLLRLMVLTREPRADYSMDILKTVARDKARPARIRLRVSAAGWRAARAA